jgi:hypothetical protein
MACVIGLTIIASCSAMYLIFQEPKASDSMVLNHQEMGPDWFTYYQIERDEVDQPEFQWYLETELRKNAPDQLWDPHGWQWYGMFIHIEIGLADSSDISKQTLESRVPISERVMPSEIGDGGWFIFEGYREGGFYCGFTVDCYYVYISLIYGVVSEIPSLVACLQIAQMQADKLT